MALLLMFSALAVPALAEEENSATDQITSATTQTGRGGRHQMPQAPGQNGQNAQMPGQNGQNAQMPGRNDQNGQTPGQNGQNGQNTQMPGRGGRHGNRSGSRNTPNQGNRTVRLGKHLDLAQLVAEGVITQEVCDAITNYLNEKAGQAQQPDAASAAAADDAESAGAPALPEDAPDGQGTAEEEVLNNLLAGGAITQEQYDQLLKRMTPPEPPATGT